VVARALVRSASGARRAARRTFEKGKSFFFSQSFCVFVRFANGHAGYLCPLLPSQNKALQIISTKRKL
jgi:hypothetical protein